MCYTHIQILLHKSCDDYFKQTRMFAKLKIKSQILKSITHLKFPQFWLWYASQLWFWIYFMISTQYRLPWFLVAVTMQKSMHELRGLQMSLAGTCPSHGGKKITFFEKNFPKIWGVNREFQEDFWEQHMALIISRFKGSSVESVPTFHPTVSECAACQGFPSSVFTSL